MTRSCPTCGFGTTAPDSEPCRECVAAPDDKDGNYQWPKWYPKEEAVEKKCETCGLNGGMECLHPDGDDKCCGSTGHPKWKPKEAKPEPQERQEGGVVMQRYNYVLVAPKTDEDGKQVKADVLASGLVQVEQSSEIDKTVRFLHHDEIKEAGGPDKVTVEKLGPFLLA